jgi:hypothetical protein
LSSTRLDGVRLGPAKVDREQIITFHDGSPSTRPITVASDGTYTTTGNSNMSADWGFITPEQKGTYTYQLVNRIKWPASTFSKTYAQCSVLVS